MKKKIIKASLFGIALLGFVSCAKIDKGADPLIVRAEQAQQIALSSFDLVLFTDDSNRQFFRENAPRFHAFAEWLRSPQPHGGTNAQRAIVLIYNVADVKSAYKKHRADSNTLATVTATLAAVARQASDWMLTISTATNSTSK